MECLLFNLPLTLADSSQQSSLIRLILRHVLKIRAFPKNYDKNPSCLLLKKTPPLF